MIVREGRVAARQTAQKPKQYQAYSFPAPSLGLIAMNNRAVALPAGAEVLENFVPTATGAIMRRGRQVHATLGDSSLPTTALFSYVLGNQRQLFGATAQAVYDITNIVNPRNILIGTEQGDYVGTETGNRIGLSSTLGLEVMTGKTGGDWVVVQMSTAGGSFLIGVNGQDPAFRYDGTAFTAANLTFPVEANLTSEDLSFVWQHKGRLWFLQKDGLTAWYLPVDQIGGELVAFPLGAELRKGGSLTFGATWSQDVGDGLNALCAFFSSEGEAVVYQGSNPSSASDWSIVGVYQVGRPLGPKAQVQIGGDIAIATDVAFVPLSEALRREYSQLGANSLSAPIEALWPEEVSKRGAGVWNAVLWTARQLVLIGLPTVNEQPDSMLVMNSRTGKWARFTNWGSTCLHVFNDRLFIGDDGGRVYEAGITGLDGDLPFTATYAPVFDQLDQPGHKTVHMARPVLKSAQSLVAAVETHTDHEVRAIAAPGATPVEGSSAWGSFAWDSATWGAAPVSRIQQAWRSQFGAGEVVSVGIQITSGSQVPLDAEIIRTDVLFTLGDVLS